MDKRYLHYLWTRIRPIKTWYLFAAFLLTAIICVAALRSNYAGMVTLRDAVYEADKNNGDIEQSLQNLRGYVARHMNTNLDTGKGVYPPIQLKYTYERLVQAEKKRVAKANSQIYTNAQKHCEKIDPNSFYGRNRVPCIQSYIKDHPETKARNIPDALYKFDFSSPRWSPDLAGWMFVLSGVLLILTIIRFCLGRWLRYITK